MNSVPDPNVRRDEGGWISGPSLAPGSESDHGAYYIAVSAEDSRLDAILASLRQQEDAGHITTREAADSRVSAMQRHLAACQELRQRLLGGS
jgi:hypothetical protein